MIDAERIAHMKEQMRPSEELLARVRQEAGAAPSVQESRRVWIPRAAAACCLVAVIAAAAWSLPHRNPGLDGADMGSPSGVAPQLSQFSAGGNNINGAAGDVSGIAGLSERGADSGAPQGSGAAQTGNGIYLPKLKLEEPKPGTVVDMIGLIVYRGNIYTWTENLALSTAQESALRSEYLGRTKGNIDEWSEQDDYAKEFASSIGVEDVYAMNGYDRDFRIMTSDGRGNVGLYERLNDIWLQTGADLFGKMHLKGNLNALTWQPFDQWDNGEDTSYPSDLPEGTAEAFLDSLYEANYVERSGWRELDPKLVTLTLKDGTEIHLMLLKGGYVKYMGLGGNGLFQMDSSAFDAVYDALV